MADKSGSLLLEMQKTPLPQDASEGRRRNRRILRYILTAVVAVDVILGLLLVYLVFLHVPYFNLRQVDVTGNRRLSRAEVVEAGDIEADTNLLTIDLGRIAAALRRHAWVREASVYRRFPGQLIVEIEERTPRAILAAEKLYYVDEQATIFTRLLPGDPSDLPLFTGVTPEQLGTERAEIQEMIRAGLGLLDLLERRGSVIDPAGVAEMRVGLDDGLSLHLRSGQMVILGKTGFEFKLERYAQLKKYLIRNGQWNSARIINLDFEDRALVRSSEKARLQG